MYPLGILSKLVSLLPSSTSPSKIPESELHFAFHQWKRKTLKDFPLLESKRVIFTISSDTSSRQMYRTSAELEMQHWQAQMRIILNYPKLLCVVLLPFNLFVPSSNSLKGGQRPSSHTHIYYQEWDTFWGVSSCSCPHLCGPKIQVCIRLPLLIRAGESTSLQPPSSDGHG